MAAFEAFDAFLSRHKMGDAWNDVLSDDADKILESFSDADWQKLHAVWHSRSISWQELLVDCLDTAPVSTSTLLLVEMILNGGVEVALFALKALQNNPLAEQYVDDDLKQRISELMANSTIRLS